MRGRSEISRDEQENGKDIPRSIQGVVNGRNVHNSTKREYDGRERGGRVSERIRNGIVTYVVLSFERGIQTPQSSTGGWKKKPM